MKNRDFEMAAALVSPDTGRRSLSAGSLLLLEMLENPLAALDAEVTSAASGYHVAEFLWVHEEELERVRAAACVAKKNPLGVQQMVLQWVEGKLSLGALAEARAWVQEEVERALACMAVHEKENESKNAPGPCSVSA